IVDTKAVAAEAKLDGKFLLSCTDDSLPAADAARLFKGLLDVEYQLLPMFRAGSGAEHRALSLVAAV
ncbi:MAG: hypothetical protein WCF04_07465, partial [Candidatus Nanopelagicales bacterium]